MILFVKTML